ncbi:delta and Notch-like epidermal growth factor-related receptor [Lingula anatina]|uniref:Delta and Notch-like epidermal growth factor-related receptor n=1 Tax=Lingula anatina TaxID=7574 RepID=A0A1S3HJH5_LINAN|nr:delta and Notch-like epidermal growth factor-related receptor [Lingula anatina]|eukprot:XP_013385606.1 delta and Notch-like epidermal growth factor-related receptor [Lingula anatina]
MCFDHGNYFSCKCHAGFAGHQCEIDINECDSSPCKNGGKCHDKVNGFFCDCPAGYVGTRCQTKENSQDKPLSDVTHSSHSSRSVEHVHSTNLYIIVGTSSGTMLMVLLVLAGCYCHTHWPERNFWPRKYSEYQSVGDKTSQDLSSILTPGPSHDAIYEANALDYSDSTLNSPIANSLKPKRV